VIDEPPSLSGIRVLVVEDEDDARDMVRSVLAHHGAVVAVAANASEALQQYAAFDPEVLLVDIAMPGMDGYTLLRQIRDAEKGSRSVPAVALTALARREDRERALASGFSQHLAKPVEPGRLVRAVAEASRR
jgi:CheY-like chemotaxis protein